MNPTNSIEKIIKSSTKNIISPLYVVLGMLVLAFISSLWFSAPELVVIILLCGLILILLLIVVAYVYFGLKSPDRLQSEEHVQEMTAMSLGTKKHNYIEAEVVNASISSDLEKSIGSSQVVIESMPKDK